MSTVTLNKAYEIYNKRVKNLKKKSVYSSHIKNRVLEDTQYLFNTQKLYTDIKNAERINGIDLILERIKILELEKNFLDTSKSNNFQSKSISKEDREVVSKMFAQVTSEIEYFKDMQISKAENIWVEV